MKKNNILTIISLIVLAAALYYGDKNLDSYKLRILNLCAIYAVLGVSMNLINGFTGQFSLGHAGFMAVGAYTTALFIMPAAIKEQNFFLKPLMSPLDKIHLPFILALIAGGLLAAAVAYLIGYPVLRLKGDYLAIATLGFSEIIRILFTNAQSVTNGSLGLKSIPTYTNLWWSFGIAVFTIVLLTSILRSSYGRAFKAIRDDEIAAESMGINLFKHKMWAFVIGAFFAGLGGGLLASLIGAIDPLMFRFFMTYNILLIIVLGGLGSITGTVISAFIITIATEGLRFLDESVNIGEYTIQGIPGLRMVVFSLLLMIVIIFFRNGLMGKKEFCWASLKNPFSKASKAGGK